MCLNGTNQIDRKRDSFPVWSHPCKKPPEVKKNFLTRVNPSYFPAKVVRCNEWQRRSRDKSRLGMVNLNEKSANHSIILFLHINERRHL